MLKSLKATPKKKQAILKMLGSNFSYKDKEVSVELTSVFNYLLNSPFVKYGAGFNWPLSASDYGQLISEG